MYTRLKELYTDSKGNLNPAKRQSFNNITEIQAIVNSQSEFKNVAELLWAIKNNCYIRPTCSICNSTNVKLNNGIKNGFYKTCSKLCAAKDPNRKEKIKQTELLRYGGPHTQNAEFKKRLKEKYPILPGSFGTLVNKIAIKEKYGVDNIFQSDIIKNKIKTTNLKKYGVENPQQCVIIRQQTKDTNLNRYGTITPLANNAIKNKIKTTNLKKYGVENPQQNKDIRAKTVITNINRYGVSAFNPIKTKQTMMSRYGVEHALQNPTIFEKTQRAQAQTRYKFKSFLSPLGKIIWYQGYEKEVIEYIFTSGITEDDLTNVRYEVPIIKYDFEGKLRTYFPDIFIKSKNMLIEVKSTYTFDKEVKKNLAKQKAAIDAGYHHIILIWSKRDNCIAQIINPFNNYLS